MKVVLILLVFAFLGLGGAAFFGVGPLASPESRACSRLARLCGLGTSFDDHRCRQALIEMRRLGGEPAWTRAAHCVGGAQACGAAVGCLAGGLGSGLVDQLLVPRAEP